MSTIEFHNSGGAVTLLKFFTLFMMFPRMAHTGFSRLREGQNKMASKAVVQRWDAKPTRPEKSILSHVAFRTIILALSFILADFVEPANRLNLFKPPSPIFMMPVYFARSQYRFFRYCETGDKDDVAFRANRSPSSPPNDLLVDR
ncbi:hypothetical protein M514_16357 [Trichuris suis]|uniref:Uncharacterized protein n=1 Tax=Trichuris suis TaxID=68888 RepID=A0A085NPM9_9BILA|nr:hypothetical protein M514_16357 [Trichuris suis]